MSGIIELIQAEHPTWMPPEGHPDRSLSCLCPYHQEKNRSATVNIEQGWFRCHGCGVTRSVHKPPTVQAKAPQPRTTAEKRRLPEVPNMTELEALTEEARRYYGNVTNSPAARYLAERFGSLWQVAWRRFALGYTQDRLVIPYLRTYSVDQPMVIQIRTRCIRESCVSQGKCVGHNKYMGRKGAPARMFNTQALVDGPKVIGITEGEMDTIAAEVYGLVRSVGIPGATNWDTRWASVFHGFDRVYVFGDGDDPGYKFAETVAADLPNAMTVVAPEGMDLDSVLRTPDGLEQMKGKLYG